MTITPKAQVAVAIGVTLAMTKALNQVATIINRVTFR